MKCMLTTENKLASFLRYSLIANRAVHCGDFIQVDEQYQFLRAVDEPSFYNSG
jgi:hypothetical protein